MNHFVQGMKTGIPIALGYFAVSCAYGMSAIAQGISVLEATLISITNLTSAGQFAGTSLLAIGAGYGEVILTQLIINARYFLMSVSLSQKTDQKVSMAGRLLMAFGITDEIFAAAIGEKGKISLSWFLGLMFLPIIGWTAGTFVGAAASSVLPTDLVNALGLSMYGMFIAIFVPKAKKEKPVLWCVLFSILLSCLFAFVPGLKNLSSGYTIVIITMAVSMFMAWKFPVQEEQS